MTKRWYALHVRSGFETAVQTKLEKKGYDVFVPTYISKRRDRIRSMSVPLFAGYVMCRLDSHARHTVLFTPGVKSVVGTRNLPFAVDAKEIEAIRQVLASRLAPIPWPYLKDGQRIHIMSGPLKGVDGIAVSNDGVDHLVLSINLLKRSVAVEIDQQWRVRTHH